MTEYLYYINIFFTLVIFAFFSFLMFLRKEKLQRSNIILIILLLLTTITYICCFLGIKKEDAVFNFTSIQILLSGIFFNLLNILYITEIIGKTNITLKNTFKYHLPSLIYFIIYLVSISLGIKYEPFNSVKDLFYNLDRFDVIFRLYLFFCLPIPFLGTYFYIQKKKKKIPHSRWLYWNKILFFITFKSSMDIFIISSNIYSAIFYFLSVASVFAILQIELKYRTLHSEDFIENPQNDSSIYSEPQFIKTEETHSEPSREFILFCKIDKYVKENQLWRDSSLTMPALAKIMNTNRTTLNQAIQEGGYTNYNNYINKMRIDDFISIVKTSEPQLTYKEIFLTVGYTSKASAMRNFKLYTGMIPSEYFVQFKIYEEYERERKN